MRKSDPIVAAIRLLTLLWLLLAWPLVTLASTGPIQPSRDVGFDQRLDHSVTPDTAFTDSSGQPMKIADLLGSKPLIVVPAYYRCPNLCSLTLEGLAESLQPLALKAGNDFEVALVSIDPNETPTEAATKQSQLRQSYPQAVVDNWHFLTGSQSAINRLTGELGFRYAYDAERNQYAHAAGMVILTAEGRIARYYYGVRFPAQGLRFGLVEAGRGNIGSVIDQVLLLCYDYDPVTGRYTLVIMKTLRLAGLVTVIALGGFLLVMVWRERRRS